MWLARLMLLGGMILVSAGSYHHEKASYCGREVRWVADTIGATESTKPREPKKKRVEQVTWGQLKSILR